MTCFCGATSVIGKPRSRKIPSRDPAETATTAVAEIRPEKDGGRREGRGMAENNEATVAGNVEECKRGTIRMSQSTKSMESMSSDHILMTQSETRQKLLPDRHRRGAASSYQYPRSSSIHRNDSSDKSNQRNERHVGIASSGVATVNRGMSGNFQKSRKTQNVRENDENVTLFSNVFSSSSFFWSVEGGVCTRPPPPGSTFKD